MILPMLLAAAVAAAPPKTADTVAKVDCASRKGPDAPLCRALQAEAGQRFAEAAAEFETAADASGTANRDEAARALAAAGNMWIAAGEPAKAALALDKALAMTELSGAQRGEALLDRARAAEAQNDLKTARARVRDAAHLVAGDPFLWYFSAALAIRENDIPTAKAAIARALRLLPDDPTILFEAGHVAQLADEDSQARAYWNRTLALDPNGPSGAAARRALAMLPAPLEVRTAPAAEPPSPRQPRS